MKGRQWVKLGWLSGAIFFSSMSVYSTYYVSPELGITFAFGLLAISFPVGLAAMAIIPSLLMILGIVKFNIAVSILSNALIVAAGYCQWFMLIPFIKNKRNQ